MIFNAKIVADRLDYCGHCSGLASDPKYNMCCTLEKLAKDTFYSDSYENKIKGMTFVEERITFSDALYAFSDIADKFISGYESDTEVEEQIEARLERIGKNGERGECP